MQNLVSNLWVWLGKDLPPPSKITTRPILYVSLNISARPVPLRDHFLLSVLNFSVCMFSSFQSSLWCSQISFHVQRFIKISSLNPYPSPCPTYLPPLPYYTQKIPPPQFSFSCKTGLIKRYIYIYYLHESKIKKKWSKRKVHAWNGRKVYMHLDLCRFGRSQADFHDKKRLNQYRVILRPHHASITEKVEALWSTVYTTFLLYLLFVY